MIPGSASAKVCIDGMSSGRNDKVGGSSCRVGIKDRLNNSRLIDRRTAFAPTENHVILPEHNIDRAGEAWRRSQDGAESEKLTDCIRLPIANGDVEN